MSFYTNTDLANSPSLVTLAKLSPSIEMDYDATSGVLLEMREYKDLARTKLLATATYTYGDVNNPTQPTRIEVIENV